MSMKTNHAAMGARLRELRIARGVQQGEVARRLEISPAYLSLIEKGKRAMQLPLLFKALELFEVSMEEFMASLGEPRVDDGLARLLDEPLMRSLNLTEDDLTGIGAEPKVVTTITALFNLYKNTRTQLDNVLAGLARREADDDEEDSLRFDYSPFDEVTDFLEQHDNWFGHLEERAERLRRDTKLDAGTRSSDLVRVLREHFDVTVKTTAAGHDSSVIRRWDAESQVLTVSDELFEQRPVSWRATIAFTPFLRSLRAKAL